MTVPVRLRPEAEADLVDATLWYERQRAGLGGEFVSEAEAVLAHMAETPLAYASVMPRLRRAFMRRFPFAVFYLVEDANLVVIGILHASRHPRAWKQRL